MGHIVKMMMKIAADFLVDWSVACEFFPCCNEKPQKTWKLFSAAAVVISVSAYATACFGMLHQLLSLEDCFVSVFFLMFLHVICFQPVMQQEFKNENKSEKKEWMHECRLERKQNHPWNLSGKV